MAVVVWVVRARVAYEAEHQEQLRAYDKAPRRQYAGGAKSVIDTLELNVMTPVEKVFVKTKAFIAFYGNDPSFWKLPTYEHVLPDFQIAVRSSLARELP